MSAQQVIEGHAYWSFVTAPNTRFTPCYSVNLVVDADLAADFKSRGFPVKEMDEGTALVIKRKVSKSNGEINEAPKLIDKYKKPLNLEVGNGSRVKVLCREWETTWKGQVFKGLDFEAMQVIDLVQYNSGLTIESAFDVEAEEEEL
jgi:hypothetical protein